METRESPLQGIRVVDFCAVYAGPVACSMLGILGAEVIKVESQARPDTLRTLRLPTDPQSASGESRRFHIINHNKRGVTINLRHPKGAELAKRLVAISDVAAESFRPGVMEDLGLGYEELRTVRPDIIMLSLSGMGDSGPERRYGALAAIFAALGGLSHLTGYLEGVPTEYRGSVDMRSGLIATFAVLAALYHRQQTGQGQRIDLSAREAMSCLIGDALMDYSMNRRIRGRTDNRDEAMAPHNSYRCKGNDHWVTIAVATDDEWVRLCNAMGRPDLADDQRWRDARDRWQNQAELDAIISQWTGSLSSYEVMRTLQKAGVAAMPTLRSDDICSDPHLTARSFLHPVDHVSVGKVTLLNPPWKLSDSAGLLPAPGPALGQDNDYVFGELLRMTPEAIQTLMEERVIY